MSDPLSDPRAAQLLATDPAEIDSLASFFQTVSGQAQDAASGLQGAHGDETWTGGAADAFRSKLGKLPGDLATVQSSYADAAHALRTYATNVAPIKSQFQALAQQLQAAQGQLAGAQGTLHTAQGSLTSAQSSLSSAQSAPKATSTDPAVTTAKGAVSSAQANLTSAQGAVTRLSGEVSGLDGRGFHLLDEFDTVRGQCRAAINHAGGKAPQHHSSLFGSICHIADDVGNFVAGAAKGVWEHIKDLPAAAVAFATHPSWESFTRFGEDLAVTASIVAMVAAPFAAPELAGADLAVDGAVAAGDAAEGGAVAAEGGAAAAQGGAQAGAEGAAQASRSLFTRGATQTSTWGSRVTTASGIGSAGGQLAQGHLKQAGLDAAFVIAPNLGHIPTSIDEVKTLGDQTASVLGIGERQAGAAATAATSAQDYRILSQMGINPEGARSLAFDSVDSTPAALRTGDPAPETIQSTVSAAQAAAHRAATIATKLGKPVAIALDNLVYDPTKSALAGSGGDK